MSFCARCGAALGAASFCPSCGQPVRPQAGPPAYAAQPSAPPAFALPPAEAPPAQRPVGVTIVAIVLMVGAGLVALAMLVFALAGAAVGAAFFDEIPVLGALAGVFLLVILLVVLVVAAVGFAVGTGLLQGQTWAWYGFVILAGLNVLGQLTTLAQGEFDGVLGLLAWGGAGAYFFHPDVRAWCRVGGT